MYNHNQSAEVEITQCNRESCLACGIMFVYTLYGEQFGNIFLMP